MNTSGKRVGAILGADNGVVEFLGYGTYVGDEVPNEAVGFMAEMLKKLKRPNPKIVLDSGKVVYGCECWWGAEEKVKEILNNAKEIKHVDIDEIRNEYRSQ